MQKIRMRMRFSFREGNALVTCLVPLCRRMWQADGNRQLNHPPEPSCRFLVDVNPVGTRNFKKGARTRFPFGVVVARPYTSGDPRFPSKIVLLKYATRWKEFVKNRTLLG